MLSLILMQLGFIFAQPVINAYAQQVRTDVIVSATYSDVRPLKVCVLAYPIDDVNFESEAEPPHCWVPNNDIGDNDLWPNHSIFEFNFKVIFYLPKGSESIFLVRQIET